MGKKGKELHRREFHQLYRLYYESVRRNPEYKAAYEIVNEHPLGPEEGRKFLAWVWRILPGDELPDPSQRPCLSEALKHPLPSETEASRDPKDFLRVIPDGYAHSVGNGTLVMDYFSEDTPGRARCMVLSMLLPKEHLVKRFKAWIDEIYRQREAKGLGQKLVLPRLHREEYLGYLRAYDLRKDGKTFKEIGESLWPDYRGDLEKKAQRYYRRGEELVMKTWLTALNLDLASLTGT